MPTVEALQIKLRSGIPMKPQDHVRLIGGLGIDGDANARSGSRRQVLMIPAETLETFDLAPGDARENITTRGLDLHSLPRGTVLKVGSARLQLTVHCAPCKHLDDLRPGLSRDMQNQRGMLFTVLDGGEVHVGDEIIVVI
jgi:cyclic pyranopterin phosphate synthase